LKEATEKSKTSIGNRLMEVLSAGDDEAKWTRFRRKATTLVSRTIDANFNKTDNFLNNRSIQNVKIFATLRGGEILFVKNLLFVFLLYEFILINFNWKVAQNDYLESCMQCRSKWFLKFKWFNLRLEMRIDRSQYVDVPIAIDARHLRSLQLHISCHKNNSP